MDVVVGYYNLKGDCHACACEQLLTAHTARIIIHIDPQLSLWNDKSVLNNISTLIICRLRKFRYKCTYGLNPTTYVSKTLDK